MGTGNFTNQNDGEVANASDVQQVIDALKVDLVPRNSGGVPADNAGDLGTSSYQWHTVRARRTAIEVGGLWPGMIMAFHSYNGMVSIGNGWFPCNGDIINEANYDSIHGAGSWASLIVSSDMEGLYSPNLTDKYLTGVSSTTQDGSSAITFVGNSSNSATTPLHTHSSPIHNHSFTSNSLDGNFFVWDSSGGLLNINGEYSNPGGGNYGISVVNSGNRLSKNLSGVRTANNSAQNTGAGGASSMNIRPHSVEVIFYIRIV